MTVKAMRDHLGTECRVRRGKDQDIAVAKRWRERNSTGS